MIQKRDARYLIVALAILGAIAVPAPEPIIISAREESAARSPSASDEPEYAPIVEREMSFYDFTLPRIEGGSLNLREYVGGRPLVIVGYVAGWCKNSNENGHVVKRLFDKYKARRLGVILVSEYSSPEEIRTHVNRIGVDYPVVTETGDRDARKKSQHYKYRRQADDKRKWGTPFYVILDRKDLEAASAGRLLARRVYTVSGEIVEAEAERFIEQRLSGPG